MYEKKRSRNFKTYSGLSSVHSYKKIFRNEHDYSPIPTLEGFKIFFPIFFIRSSSDFRKDMKFHLHLSLFISWYGTGKWFSPGSLVSRPVQSLTKLVSIKFNLDFIEPSVTKGVFHNNPLDGGSVLLPKLCHDHPCD